MIAYHLEQQADVFGRTRHGTADAQQPAGMGDEREVPRGRHAPWRWLQARDPAEVRRHANRAAAVAAHSARRAERSDRRRLAPAGPARGARNVPRVIGAAGDVVVGLVVVEELGAVGLAEQDRARCTEPRGRGGILSGPMIETQPAAAISGLAGHVKAVLDRQRDAVQRSQGALANPRLVGRLGRRAGLLREN